MGNKKRRNVSRAREVRIMRNLKKKHTHPSSKLKFVSMRWEVLAVLIAFAFMPCGAASICSWNVTQRMLPVDADVVLECSVSSNRRFLVSYSVSSPPASLLDVMLLDEESYQNLTQNDDWDCLQSPKNCLFDTSSVTGVMDFTTSSSSTNQTIYFVISNENLIASVNVNFSVSFQEATQQSSRIEVVLLVSCLMVTILAVLGIYLITRHIRRNLNVHHSAERVPLVSSSDDMNADI